MNYEEMSDKEVNIAVASAVGESPFVSKCINFGGSESSVAVGFGNCMRTVDYCNNVEDAWPIIFENGISMCKPNSYRDEWSCFSRDSVGFVSNIVYHERPLRAAMIVFLMMKDEQRND